MQFALEVKDKDLDVSAWDEAGGCFGAGDGLVEAFFKRGEDAKYACLGVLETKERKNKYIDLAKVNIILVIKDVILASSDYYIKLGYRCRVEKLMTRGACLG